MWGNNIQAILITYTFSSKLITKQVYMDILKKRGFTQYPLSAVKQLFRGNNIDANAAIIRYVYLIFNQDECLFISSTDPPKMKDVLRTLRTQGSLLTQEIKPDTLIYAKGYTDSEIAITEENEIREQIKPRYNALAPYHGIFESIKKEVWEQ